MLFPKAYTGDDVLFFFFTSMAAAVPSFPTFDIDKDQASSIRWKKCLQCFENFIVAPDIKDDQRKCAMLLHHAGDSVQDISDTLTDTGEAKDYKCAKDK